MTALTGWRVLVPRPPGRSSSLVALLESHGAVAQAVPLIGFEPPADTGALDLAVLALAGGNYDWVGFTSVTAVDAVVTRARALQLFPAVPADTRIAAVGASTAAALRQADLPVHLTPDGAGSAAALASCWPAAHPGETVLLPQSEIAGATLRDVLQSRGFQVTTVVAYRTVESPPTGDVADALAAGRYQAVLLTSPSTVRALAAVPVAAGTVLGAIGSATASAAADAGLPLALTAAEPTDAALVTALVRYAATPPIRKS